MEVAAKRKRGRPPTGWAMPAAERARRYRALLRAKGVRVRTRAERDPLLARVQFGRETFLTPGEQDVLRRFCARFRDLPRLPRKVSVFGSRARGGAHAQSDLDVAVLVDGSRDSSMDAALSAIAFAAQKNYWLGEYGISLRPVAFYAGEAAAFLEAIGEDEEAVWTRP